MHLYQGKHPVIAKYEEVVELDKNTLGPQKGHHLSSGNSSASMYIL